MNVHGEASGARKHCTHYSKVHKKALFQVLWTKSPMVPGLIYLVCFRAQLDTIAHLDNIGFMQEQEKPSTSWTSWTSWTLKASYG